MKRINRMLDNNEIEEREVKEAVTEIPETFEKDYMDAFMEEVNSKTLNLIGEFNEDMVRHVQAFANNLWYYKGDTKKPLLINISSYGGFADSLLAILDILESLKAEWGCRIITNANGYAHSCGFILWCYGDDRYMGEYAELMCHQVSYGLNSNILNHDIELKRNKKLQEKIDKIICEKTSLSKATLKKWYKKDKDKFIDYEEALELGILTIDEEEEIRDKED